MILIRHGQSEWNAIYNRTRIDPGIPDPPLTETGREQALRAAEGLAARNPIRLLVSPYRRTLQTAEIIAKALSLPIVIEPLVRERAAFSCDVGTARSHLAAAWPHLKFDHLDEVWWPAEETEHELADRCGRFRRHMKGVDDWAQVAVISHWGFIRGLTGQEVRNGEAVPFDPR
ncbi:MAG TPA: histidine phosphatase family protein [Dongiaceae bacterium]|jgi:broad specificity phosphatase PhoE